MKGNFRRIIIMVREDLYTVMETCMKETGLTAKQKEMESTFIMMDPHTRVSGRMMCNEVLERKNGQMGPHMQGNIRLGRRMGRVSSNGEMDLLTQDTSTKTTSTAKVSTSGPTTENMMENGK